MPIVGRIRRSSPVRFAMFVGRRCPVKQTEKLYAIAAFLAVQHGMADEQPSFTRAGGVERYLV